MTALATDSGRKTPARLAGSAILAVQSDERLVKLVRSGHERAFEAIVDRYRKALVRYCRRILPESRCEDAVQQAFLNAHTALTTSDDAVQLKPWLFAITRNAALNMLRQNGWNYDEIPLDFDGVRRPDQVFEERFELQQTVAAVNALPGRQRDALVMRELEGRSYDEIAAALGANDGAVRQLLNRARVTLRSAASALIPPPLVARAAASMPPSDGRRIAEIMGGLGAAGIAKAGAAAVVAGTLVVGAVEAPLPVGESHKATREKAALSADRPATARADRPVANHPTAAVAPEPARTHAPAAKPQRAARAEQRHSGSAAEPRRTEPEDRHRPGTRDDSRERSGSGEDRSGSGGSVTRETTEAEDRSGPGGGDDTTATLVPTDTSGTPGTGGGGSDDSLSSGSSSTESGSSGSGTSGSDDVTSTSGTSGTSGSGSDH